MQHVLQDLSVRQLVEHRVPVLLETGVMTVFQPLVSYLHILLQIRLLLRKHADLARQVTSAQMKEFLITHWTSISAR